MPRPENKRRRTIKGKMDCTAIKELLSPKTLNKFTFALVIFWILIGAMLCGAFLEMENNEPRYDFRCDVKGNIWNIDFIRGKCYDQYRTQNHKLVISPLVFILVNVSLIPAVTVIYSVYANSIVNGLKRSHQDAQGEPTNRRRTLFIAYLCRLIICVVFHRVARNEPILSQKLPVRLFLLYRKSVV